MNTNEKTLEPEMDNYQKRLVDNCFEEGQYASGVKTLDQLRSPTHRPAANHIQQLLYIALYPHNANKAPQIPGSPSKMDKRWIKIQTLSISRDTSLAAQNVLFSFAQTNSLEAIFKALPACSRNEDPTSSDMDSALANEALCIPRCKSCWNLLAKDFIRPGGDLHNERRRHNVNSDSEEESAESVVAEHAWPILEWLLFLFERDEAFAEREGLPRYSPFLLDQIPVPRGERNLRWEVDAPLDIMFSCLGASESRQLLGVRLLSLIINLSCTSYFDFQAFLVSVYKRVSARSNILDLFLTLMSRLPSTQAVLRFKVAFLHRCIGPTAAANAGASSKTARPKPQVRVQPKQRRRGEAVPEPTPSETPNQNQPTASRPAMPSFVDISEALEGSSADNSAKFELLVSYWTLQSQLEASERDSDWIELRNNGRWESLLNVVFRDGDGADNYRTTLGILGSTW
ncbi:Superkiller protein 3 [Marasmius crinis-equi]|uniref:Superkiller protein 3 n=1 Tax=Marasmius crinis-equi TaxID=585013 RepID=A0ABR3F7U8_9AGAR